MKEKQISINVNGFDFKIIKSSRVEKRIRVDDLVEVTTNNKMIITNVKALNETGIDFYRDNKNFIHDTV